MSEEIWKDVVGYEGMYQVSSHGRVMRVAGGQGTWAERILRPRKGRNGYVRVGLSRGGENEDAYIHRLVAEAFLGLQPSPDHEVNHKNGIRDDNRVENLEWVTRSQNLKHAYRTLGVEPRNLRGEDIGNSRLTYQEVRQLRRLYMSGEYTQAELARRFGVSQSTVSRTIRGETWKDAAGPCSRTNPRPALGERCGNARLERNDVIKIRKLYATGEHTQVELGEMFGVTHPTISNIINRKTWKHVPQEGR